MSRAALLVAAACASLACRGRPRPPPAAAESPAPSRPAGLAGRAHLGAPRSLVDAIDQALGARHPPELLLAVGLGVDVAVLSAVDLARPVDVALLGAPAGAFAFALTPAGAGNARSLLAPRYRLTVEPGLGERLQPRGDPGLSAGDRRLPCALVRVPARVPVRVVCASDESALRAAGRWVAYESAARADDRDALTVDLDGEGRAGDLVPALREAARGLGRQLLAAAGAARRSHDRPPELGDPEAAASLLGELARALVDDVAAARAVTLRATLREGSVDVTAGVTFPAAGGGPLAADARARAGVTGPHPLLALVPADAVFTAASRTAPAARRAGLAALTDGALRVLGARVPAPELARRDLDALLAHSAEGVAVAAAPDARGGLELTLALAQDDQGAGARATLARLALAPWLRAGGATVTPLRDGLVVTPPAPAARALALGLRRGALLCVLGRNARATLDAAGLRGEGEPEPAGAFAELRLAPTDDPLRVTWEASRAAEGVTATARTTLPPRALAALAALAE